MRRFRQYSEEAAQQASSPGQDPYDPAAADLMFGTPWLPVVLPDADTTPTAAGSLHLLGLGRDL